MSAEGWMPGSVPTEQFACRAHWYAIPLELRNRIWRGYRRDRWAKRTSRRCSKRRHISMPGSSQVGNDRILEMVGHLDFETILDVGPDEGSGMT